MDRTGAVALGAALAVVCGAGWLLMNSLEESREPVIVKTVSKQLPTAEQVDAAALQELATESCICARSTAGSDCWAEYRERVADFEVESIAAACLPLSTENDCVMTTEGEVCWLTGFGESGICTSEEADAAEHAFNTAPPGREYQAMEAVVSRIRKGEKIPVEPDREGCV